MTSTVAANEAAPLLEARGIVKAYPGVRALDGVSLRLAPGRLNALMGENGAGKSTLMKVLAGVTTPDAGELLLGGRPTRFRSPREAQETGVSIIHQELNLVPNLSVAENVFLGREPMGAWGVVDRKQMRTRAREALARLGVDVDPDTPVGRLSVATQQAVEIAKALSFDARVLILDEPTSALTAQETDALFERIAQLKREGVALAYVTHRFEELDRIADDVTVLRDGRLVGERPFASLTRAELVRMMTGRDVQLGSTCKSSSTDQPALSVRRLTLRSAPAARRPRVDSVSFEVRRGEIVSLFGLMGAGRTELLEAIFGVHPEATGGEVLVGGEPHSPRSPADALRTGVALAPEDRKLAGLVLGMTVAENVSLACLGRVSRAGVIRSDAERSLATDFRNRLRIKTPSIDAVVQNLSGGNQQKVVLAKVLATNPTVLLLDEPTRGIDIGAKQEVYALVRQLAAEGRGVLVATSEAPEALLLGDRLLVMSEGRLAAEFTRAEADEQRLVEAALPRNTEAVA